MKTYNRTREKRAARAAAREQLQGAGPVRLPLRHRTIAALRECRKQDQSLHRILVETGLRCFLPFSSDWRGDYHEKQRRSLVKSYRAFRGMIAARREAERLGLDYPYALQWNLGQPAKDRVDPAAFAYAEMAVWRLRNAGHWPLEVTGDNLRRGESRHWEDGTVTLSSNGGWDSEGHHGISPWDVVQAWRRAGCRNSLKFRWIIGTLYRLSGTGNKTHLLRLVHRGDTPEKTIRTCRGFVWLARHRPRDAASVRLSVVRMLGRLRGFARAAALEGVSLADATAGDLNWDAVRRVRELNRAQRAARYLSPATAYRYLYKVTDESARTWPHPAGLKLGAAKSLLAPFEEEGGEATPVSGLKVRLGMTIPCINLALLFGSKGAVEQYARRVEKDRGHAVDLHYLGQFQLPLVGEWNRAGWARLALKHGAKVVEYGRLFVAIEGYLGRVPRSLKELREVSGICAYRDVHPGDERLASLCGEYKLAQRDFEAYRALMKRVKTAESLPHVRVEGSEVGIEGDWVFEKLAADDPAGPLLGMATGCCQHLGGAAAECAAHGVTSPYSGFYAVWYRGRVVAQSWAWRGTRGELVFDNIEFLAGSYREASLRLYEEASRHLMGRLGVTAVLAGTAYGADYEARWKDCKKPAKMLDICDYTDAKQQVWVCHKKRPKKDEEQTWNGPAVVLNELLEGSGVHCDYCEAEVHPTAMICPACGEDISEWAE